MMKMGKEEYKDLLDRFFAGETSSAENELLYSVIGEDMDGDFEEYSLDRWTGNDYVMPESRKRTMKADIFRRISAAEVGHGRRKTWRTLAAGFAVAASVAVAAVAGYHAHDLLKPVQEFEVVAERGHKSVVTLPDGTVVWLNSDSRLTYTSDYNSKVRDIFLDGEAYFDVAKNPDLPFIVDAGEVRVKALGTKFNVRAYRDEMVIRTTLVDGKVLASSEHDNVILAPCQEAVYTKPTGRLVATDAPNIDHLVPWRADEIYLDDMSLDEIARMLERMYNVEILFADKDMAKYSYTGLIRNSSLKNVLELIAGTSPVGYRMNGNTIKFYMNE